MAKAPIAVVSKMPADAQKLFFADLDAWYKADQAAMIAAAALIKAQQAFNERLAALKISLTEGTNTIEIGFGKQLKLDQPINRSVDRAALAALQAFIADEADQSPEAIELRAQAKAAMEAAVAYKPDVSVSGFKSLDADQKKLIGDLITEKLGKVKLEIHVPKK